MTFEHLTRDELNECLPYWNSDPIGSFYASPYWLTQYIGAPDIFNDIFAKCNFYWYGKISDGGTVAYIMMNTPYKKPCLPLEPTYIETAILYPSHECDIEQYQLCDDFCDNIGAIVQLHYQNTLNA